MHDLGGLDGFGPVEHEGAESPSTRTGSAASSASCPGDRCANPAEFRPLDRTHGARALPVVAVLRELAHRDRDDGCRAGLTRAMSSSRARVDASRSSRPDPAPRPMTSRRAPSRATPSVTMSVSANGTRRPHPRSALRAGQAWHRSCATTAPSTSPISRLTGVVRHRPALFRPLHVTRAVGRRRSGGDVVHVDLFERYLEDRDDALTSPLTLTSRRWRRGSRRSSRSSSNRGCSTPRPWT